MDFKGHMPLTDGGRCHPLTMVDDHSRYKLGLAACANEQAHRAKPVGADLPPLRNAGGLLRRQRKALGRFIRPALDEVRRMACSSSASMYSTAGRITRRAAARASASTHAEGRGIRPQAASAISPRSSAPSITGERSHNTPAAAPGSRSARASQPLSAEHPLDAGSPARGRIR